MTYYLALLFTFFKYLAFLTNIFIYIKLFSLRFLLLSVLLLLIYLLLTYPKPYGPRFHKLSELRNYRNNFYHKVILSYKIKTFQQYILNVLALIIYSLIFVIGFFLLKLINKDGQINVVKMFTRLIKMYMEFYWFDKIYYLVLSFFLFILLVLLLVKIKKLFNKSFQRIHFYLFQYEWYSNFSSNFYKYGETHVNVTIGQVYRNIISYLLLGKIPKYDKGEYINLSEVEKYLYLKNKYTKFVRRSGLRIISSLIENLPFYLIFCSIGYDLVFNDLILTKVFYVYPLAHLYQLYLNISYFYEDHSPMLDDSFTRILYKPEMCSEWDISQIPGYVLNGFMSPWRIDIKNRERISKRIRRFRKLIKIKRLFLKFGR